MKLQEIRTKEGKVTYFITLPKQIVLAKGWKKGSQLEAKFDRQGNLVILEK